MASPLGPNMPLPLDIQAERKPPPFIVNKLLGFKTVTSENSNNACQLPIGALAQLPSVNDRDETPILEEGSQDVCQSVLSTVFHSSNSAIDRDDSLIKEKGSQGGYQVAIATVVQPNTAIDRDVTPSLEENIRSTHNSVCNTISSSKLEATRDGHIINGATPTRHSGFLTVGSAPTDSISTVTGSKETLGYNSAETMEDRKYSTSENGGVVCRSLPLQNLADDSTKEINISFNGLYINSPIKISDMKEDEKENLDEEVNDEDDDEEEVDIEEDEVKAVSEEKAIQPTDPVNPKDISKNIEYTRRVCSRATFFKIDNGKVLRRSLKGELKEACLADRCLNYSIKDSWCRRHQGGLFGKPSDAMEVGEETEKFVKEVLKMCPNLSKIEKIGQTGDALDIIYYVNGEERPRGLQVKTLNRRLRRRGERYRLQSSREYKIDTLIVGVSKDKTRFCTILYDWFKGRSAISLNYSNPECEYMRCMFTPATLPLFVETLSYLCPFSTIYVQELSEPARKEFQSVGRVETKCGDLGISFERSEIRNDETDCTIGGKNVQLKSSTEKNGNVHCFRTRHNRNGYDMPYSWDTSAEFFIFDGSRNDKKLFVIPKQVLLDTGHLSGGPRNNNGKTSLCLASEECTEPHWSTDYLDRFDQITSNVIIPFKMPDNTTSRFIMKCLDNGVSCVKCTKNLKASRCIVGNLSILCVSTLDIRRNLYQYHFVRGDRKPFKETDKDVDFGVFEDVRYPGNFFILNRRALIYYGYIKSEGKKSTTCVLLADLIGHNENHWSYSYYNQFSLLTSAPDTVPPLIAPKDDSVNRFQRACLQLNINSERYADVRTPKCLIGKLIIRCIYSTSTRNDFYVFTTYRASEKPYDEDTEYDFFVFESSKCLGRFFIIPKSILIQYRFIGSKGIPCKCQVRLPFVDDKSSHWALLYLDAFPLLVSSRGSIQHPT